MLQDVFTFKMKRKIKEITYNFKHFFQTIKGGHYVNIKHLTIKILPPLFSLNNCRMFNFTNEFDLFSLRLCRTFVCFGASFFLVLYEGMYLYLVYIKDMN